MFLIDLVADIKDNIAPKMLVKLQVISSEKYNTIPYHTIPCNDIPYNALK